MAKNLATFCPFPKTLSEGKFLNNGLIIVMQEISRQHSIQHIA
jgi:hypothetical protein